MEERPLSHMPGMQYKLAEMIALNEASRGIIKRSAESWASGHWSDVDAGANGAICKYIVSNNNNRVLDLAMDVAGGPGLFRQFGLERLYRDVRAGTSNTRRPTCSGSNGLPSGISASGWTSGLAGPDRISHRRPFWNRMRPRT